MRTRSAGDFLFWDEHLPFRPFFERLDLTATLELACGHGRHAEMIIDHAPSA